MRAAARFPTTSMTHGEHGRGLPLLAMSARSWGFEQLGDGRLRDWFEVPHTAVPTTREPAETDESRAAPTPPHANGTHEESALTVNRATWRSILLPKRQNSRSSR